MEEYLCNDIYLLILPHTTNSIKDLCTINTFWAANTKPKRIPILDGNKYRKIRDKNISKLTYLNTIKLYCYNNITDKGIKHLTNLTSLYLNKSMVTYNTISKLTNLTFLPERNLPIYV